MRLYHALFLTVVLSVLFCFSLFSLGVYGPHNQKENSIEYVGFLENTKTGFIGTATAVGPNTIISCHHLNINLDENLRYFYNNSGSKIIGIRRYPELDLIVITTEKNIPYRKIDKNIVLEKDLNFVGYGAGVTGTMKEKGEISILWRTGKINYFNSNIYNIENDTISFKLNKPEDGMILYGDSGGCIVVNGSPVGMFQSFAKSQDSDGNHKYTGYALDLRKYYDLIYGK